MLITHIYLNGHCSMAIDLYADAFGGEVISVIKNPNPEVDLVIHAEMNIFGNKLMLNDHGDGDGHSTSGGYQLCVYFETKDELMEVYSKFDEGSSIIMSPKPTDYSECVVRFIDKFDVHWAFVVN